MLFFLMLFAMTRMSASDKAKVAEGIQNTITSGAAKEAAARERLSKKEKEETAIKNMDDAVKQGRFAGQANITVDDKAVKIVLNPEVFFESGSATISLGTQHALDSLIQPLSQFPNEIIVEGHTDNIPVKGGRYGSNWELSVARAVSVIDFFTARGIAAKQMVAGGYGEYHPAFPNDTAENRAKNRRIEITILRQPGGGV